jgi:hypothetical protein
VRGLGWGGRHQHGEAAHLRAKGAAAAQRREHWRATTGAEKRRGPARALHASVAGGAAPASERAAVQQGLGWGARKRVARGFGFAEKALGGQG